MSSESTQQAGTAADPAVDRAAGSTSTNRGRLTAVWMRLGGFLAPLVLIVCLPVYLIDPFGLFAKPSIVSENVRVEIASRVNQLLRSFVSFARQPEPNILLGDSQMALFDVHEIDAVTRQSYGNLAYGGGTLAEAIATFWYAAGTVKLQRVYFGVSFYSFIDNPRNRVAAAKRVVTMPLAYFSNGDVLEATWDDIEIQFLHRVVSYGPAVDRATFWRRQLGELTRRKDSYPASQGTLTQLRAIASYCRKHGIDLVFVIPPEQDDVRRRIGELGMDREYADFKSTVAGLGQTYDCDISNELTRNTDNFRDPFHLTRTAAAQVAESIWSGKHRWCHLRPGGAAGGLAGSIQE